jgi:photosystem II stability/assembly factor-like uncharacterized protein
MRSLRSVAVGLSLLCLPQAVAMGGVSEKPEAQPGRLEAKTFEGLKLRGIGPALMSGRIADVAIHPKDRGTWYVAAGSGNVWKTDNSGTTWSPIFDDQGSYSIGCVTLDPRNPQVVWVGTGENVGGRHVGYGDGVYRSRDGGKTWENLGLRASEHIGRIVIDPRDSDVVYVAAQGPLWTPGGERGLYKTTDGGKTWERILGGGEHTGVNEVVMDPGDPDVLYASTHQRHRNVAALVNGGPESGIHKSQDAGKTWRRVKKGLPEEDMGRIGLAVSPIDTSIVYATVELADRKGGFYRSADGGESFEKRSDYLSGGTGPHYYQEIFASPHQLDRIYQMDVWMHVSEDGGKTFRPIGEKHKHVDNHALAFVADDPDYLLAGCDGGLYESFDLGATWKFVANLPVTQFYKVAVDYDEPFYNIYGGTQDNSTQGGPSRTDNVNGIRNSDWFLTLFADGHQPAVDPTNPDIVYSEWQQGNLVRYDRRNGEVVYIQPQPEKGEPLDRFNWDAPILISPHDPARLFYASQRVFRSDDRGNTWRPVSGDLTRGLDRLELPMMGRVHSFDAVWDLMAMSQYGTITSLSQSPLVEDLLYVGTDDGLIQVSEDGGATWRLVDRLPGAGEMFFVNDIKADLHDEDKVYACVDQHKAGDFSPYLLVSADRGRTWKSLATDLPDRHLVWRLVQDHVDPDLLFVGTELGLYFSPNAGGNWIELTGDVPNIPFRDLAIQKRENDLVGATFGRGFYVLDDYTPLRGMTEAVLQQEATLFPVRKTPWYVPRRPLGDGDQASQGDAFFVAPNPPFGAVFTYYLRDELRSRKGERREREKEIEKKRGDTPYPGWEELRKEELEEDPAIVLTVRDAAGEVVRHLDGPIKAGFHRVAWDLRYPSPEPWQAKGAEEEEEEEEDGGGWMAAPGTYTVRLSKRVDGQLTELGEARTFEVASIRKATLAGASADEAAAFFREVAELQRTVGSSGSSMDEALTRLSAIKEVLVRSTLGDEGPGAEARRLSARLEELKERLRGNRRRRAMGDPGPVSIQRRLRVVEQGNQLSLSGPTPTHRLSLEIAREELAEVRAELDRLIGVELPALEKRLDAAGVPWTPGRR